MLQEDWFILMVMGGFFVLLGLLMLFWGRREEKVYYDSLSNLVDVREYLEHSPERPQPGAVRTGGWIALAVGGLLLVVGFIIWLVGRGGA